MKYLLDTHIWIWSLLTPEKLNKNTEVVLLNEDNELFISPITIWETLVLAEKDRVVLKPSPKEWILESLKKSPVNETKLTHSIAIKSRMVELPHKDPADRFITATAWEYDMTLITEDKRIRESKQIKIL